MNRGIDSGWMLDRLGAKALNLRIAIAGLCLLLANCTEDTPPRTVIVQDSKPKPVDYRKVRVNLGKLQDATSGKDVDARELKDKGLEIVLSGETVPFEFFRDSYRPILNMMQHSFPARLVFGESQAIEYVAADSLDVTEAVAAETARRLPLAKFSLVRFGEHDTLTVESALQTDAEFESRRRTASLAVDRTVTAKKLGKAIEKLKGYGFERFTFSLAN